uniref:Uncharacterized protein n=1 Tax=Setaria digitata TaxID=48799 RepID=A0A915PFQ3_9BILA
MHLPLFCGILIEILSTVAFGQEDLVEVEVVITTVSPTVAVTTTTEEISETTTAFSPWIRPSPPTLTLNASIELNITAKTISPSTNVSDGLTSTASLPPGNVSVPVLPTKLVSTPENVSITSLPVSSNKTYLICYMLTRTCPSYGHHGQYGNQKHHGQYGSQGHHGHYGNQGHHGQYGSQGHHGHYGNQGHHGQDGNQGHHGQDGNQGHHHTNNQQCLCPPYAYICYGPYTKIACPKGIHNMDRPFGDGDDDIRI